MRARPLNIVVTGVGGFAGTAIANHLSRRGFGVLGVFRTALPDVLRSSKNFKSLQTDLRRCPPLPDGQNILVHCAAEVPAFCADPQELYASNLQGAVTLLERCRAAGVRQIINLSSMSVYGAVDAPILSETAPKRPTDPYGKAKLAAESLFVQAARQEGVSVLNLRLPGVVGAGSRNNFLSAAMAAILEGREVEASNQDALFNNLVHIDDLATFIEQQLGKLYPEAQSVNLACDEPLPVGRILELMFERAATRPRISYTVSQKRPFLIDCQAACAIGYRPASVRDSVIRFVDDAIAYRETQSSSKAFL